MYLLPTVEFYKLLGMEIRGSLRNASGRLQWVHLSCGQADLMLSRASEPAVAGKQAVLFHLYSPNLIALREHLMANGVKVCAITDPEYMLKGEICVENRDGVACSSARLDRTF